MASYQFGLETVCPTLMHRSQCCDIDGRDLLSPQTCSGRNFLHQQIRMVARQRPSSLNFCIFCLESEPQASTKKPKTAKPGRASKSDAALRTELQLFLASAGLPSDQVPSTTELSNRGREDLAKIVRRRGYKAVARLLSNPDMIPNVESKGILASNVKHGAVTEGSMQPSLNGSARSGRPDISDDTVQGLQFTEQPKDRKISFREDGDIVTSTRNDASITPFDGFVMNLDSLTEKQARDQLLQQRALKFLKTGQLDDVEGEDEEKEEEEDRSAYDFEDSSDEDENEQVWDEQKSAEAMAVEKAARLRSKLLPYIKYFMLARVLAHLDADVLSGLR